MTDSKHAKRALRDTMRDRRAALPNDVRTAAHATMDAALLALVAPTAWVGVYAAQANEADPLGFVRAKLAQGGRVSYPRVARTQLTWHQVPPGRDPETWLVTGYRGIREPPRDAPAHARDLLAWIVVPGLGFNPDGVRLGHGGGFYDRALAGYLGRTVGLCYAGQVVPELPRESHDVHVDVVVSA